MSHLIRILSSCIRPSEPSETATVKPEPKASKRSTSGRARGAEDSVDTSGENASRRTAVESSKIPVPGKPKIAAKLKKSVAFAQQTGRSMGASNGAAASDASRLLQSSQDLVMPAEILNKLDEVLEHETGYANHPNVDILSDGNNIVFRLRDTQGYIFKLRRMQNPSDTKLEERLSSIREARSLIAKSNLDLLVVPPACLVVREVNGSSMKVLAEQSVDIEPDMKAQEELYRRHDAELGPTFQQLAIFIAKTGFQDVEFRNIPLVGVHADPKKTPRGPKQVALIDLEHMDPENKAGGIVGAMYSGLIRCSTPRHFGAVSQAAKRAGLELDVEELRAAERDRKKVLSNDSKLLAHYRQVGLVSNPGREIPRLQAEFVGLSDASLGEAAEEVNAQQVVDAVVDAINENLRENAHLPSVVIKQRRSMCLNTNYGVLGQCQLLHRESVEKHNRMSDADYEKGLTIRQVIDKMVEKRIIYEFRHRNGHGYFIQA